MYKATTICVVAMMIASTSHASDAIARNKETIRHLFEVAWSKGDFDGMESYWAPTVTLHFRGEQYFVDHDGIRQIITNWRTAFPDFRFVVHDLIAENDRVAIRLAYSGTHTGREWFGIAPTGRAMNVTEMMFFRFEGGKVVEAWEDYDEYAMRQQLGASVVAPPPESTPQ